MPLAHNAMTLHRTLEWRHRARRPSLAATCWPAGHELWPGTAGA